jgi:hypothetical protein
LKQIADAEYAMIELTEQQRQAVLSGQTVRVQETGRTLVLLLEEEYEKMRALLEEERADRRVQEGWQKLAYRGLALSDEP